MNHQSLQHFYRNNTIVKIGYVGQIGHNADF